MYIYIHIYIYIFKNNFRYTVKLKREVQCSHRGSYQLALPPHYGHSP